MQNPTLQIPSNFWLDLPSTPFPALECALNHPNGLIAIGGDLSAKRLLDAYARGIFPWYNEDEPILWYSPDPRLIITQKSLHISKSLHKILRQKRFEIRTNTAFSKVIEQCRTSNRANQQGTWITQEMTHAYQDLHAQGYAHSIETYQDNQLVGGLYGVALGRVFFGESMFSLVSNASKVAFVHLLNHSDYQLVDCQVESAHLQRLGAFSIKRDLFVKTLNRLL